MEPLDLPSIGELSFFTPDETRFPATRLARSAAETGGASPAILNAANEIAVEGFLAGRCKFGDIAPHVENVMEKLELPAPKSLDEVHQVDSEARAVAQSMMENA